MTPAASWRTLAGVRARMRPWRGVLGYALFTLVVFVVALLYGLPHDLIARRALDEATADAPVRVAFDSVSFAFPNGYRFTDVRITSLERPDLAVEVPALAVSTPILGVLAGRIDSADFSGSLYGGSFEGSAETRGGRVSLSAEVDELQLAPLSQRLLPPPGAVSGTVSLDLDVAGDGRTTRTTEGRLELSAAKVALDGIVAQGFTVPDLEFDTVRLEVAMEGARLQVDAFEASGPEITVSATGDVLVREPAARSMLNLQLEIDVSPQARPGLRVATALLPPRSPTQPNRWSLRGSLAAPSLH